MSMNQFRPLAPLPALHQSFFNPIAISFYKYQPNGERSKICLYLFKFSSHVHHHTIASSMEIPQVHFSDLKAVGCRYTVQAILLCFWEAQNVKKGSELLGVDMLLIDAQATTIQFFINVHRTSYPSQRRFGIF
ncbi:hypothetical protein Bca101_045108 [Brassica carinata]